MSKKINFDYTKALSFFSQTEIDYFAAPVKLAHEQLHNKSGAGSDYLGWIDLPTAYDKEEFARIQQAAKKIQSDSEVLIVIGIGGSYLGARAAIEALSHSFYNNLSKDKRKTPEVYFAGNNISSTYITHLLDLVEGKDFSVNVISKSGTTTERLLPSVSSVQHWRRNTVRKKHANGSTLQQTRRRAHLRSWLTKKAMSRSSSLMM